jgi:DNA-binding transcriptional LysR family regulator
MASSTAVAAYLPADLAVFLQGRPTVRVQLEERLSHEVVVAVADGRADLGIVSWVDEHPDLAFRHYRHDELVMIAPAAKKLRKGHGGVRFLDCLNHPFVSLSSGTAMHTFLTSKAAALSQHLDVRVQLASFGAVISMVASGVGIAVVPRVLLRQRAAEAINVIPLLEPWAKRELRVCWRKDGSRQSDHVRALLQQLCGDAEEAFASP